VLVQEVGLEVAPAAAVALAAQQAGAGAEAEDLLRMMRAPKPP